MATDILCTTNSSLMKTYHLGSQTTVSRVILIAGIVSLRPAVRRQVWIRRPVWRLRTVF